MPHKAIVEESEIRILVEHFTREVSLEKLAAVAAVGNFDRRRIVVLNEENIAFTRLEQRLVYARQVVRIYVYEDPRNEGRSHGRSG